ncbi:MAG: hypothetical protein HC810_01000 [Acaryochloridaceae cyanobacterium RL_2_7]|nr:hypothetical protein [Acaryochloridaceae cyanobacterium RL_2_7]
MFLHIGLHKTGSTYIQKVFAENRELIRELGIDYPSLGAEFLFGHHNLAWSLMPGKQLLETTDFSIAKLTQYLHDSSVESTVLSSEEFDFLKIEHISKIYQVFSDFEVKIVFYVRHPLNAFYSLWQEAVKHGDTTSLESFLENIRDRSHPFNYWNIANQWAHYFGPNSLQIVIYDNLVEKDLDIFIYFF